MSEADAALLGVEDHQSDPGTPSILGLMGALWGLVGMSILLGNAIMKLTLIALEPFQQGMVGIPEGLLYLLAIVVNVYAEGIRGFQKSFSPRFAARVIHLRKEPTFLRALLAPAFCMGFFHATKKRIIVTWTLLVMIVVLIWLVGMTPQPWRGIIDAGVVAGLLWGLCATLVYVYRGWRGELEDLDPNLPAIKVDTSH